MVFWVVGEKVDGDNVEGVCVEGRIVWRGQLLRGHPLVQLQQPKE